MIAAVLLAAGSASRFGGAQKLLATVNTGGTMTTLVRHAATALFDAGLQHVVVVVGRDADRVRESLSGLDVRTVVNSNYASGLSSSLRTGISEAARLWPDAAAFLIALGDQPLTGTRIVESILHEGAAGDRPTPAIVAPRFRGELGNPVLFARAVLPELLSVSGDRGARSVIERDPSRVLHVDFDRPMPPDVDTLSDLASLTGVRPSR